MFCGFCKYVHKLCKKIKTYFYIRTSTINHFDTIQQEKINKPFEKQPLIKKKQRKPNAFRYNLKPSPLKFNKIAIPHEIIIEILSFLSITSVIKYRRISKGMKHIIESLDFKNHINNLIKSKSYKFNKYNKAIFNAFQLKLDRNMNIKQFLELMQSLKQLPEFYENWCERENNNIKVKFYKNFLNILAQNNIKQKDAEYIDMVTRKAKATNKNLFSRSHHLCKIFIYCSIFCTIFSSLSIALSTGSTIAINSAGKQFCHELARNMTMNSENCGLLITFSALMPTLTCSCVSMFLTLISCAMYKHIDSKEETNLYHKSQRNDDVAKQEINKRSFMYLVREIIKIIHKPTNKKNIMKKEKEINNDDKNSENVSKHVVIHN